MLSDENNFPSGGRWEVIHNVTFLAAHNSLTKKKIILLSFIFFFQDGQMSQNICLWSSGTHVYSNNLNPF